MTEKMKVYYIFDAYCGWCYGFEEILKPFTAAHPELDVKVISGGLFTEGHSLSDYPHMPGANARISEIFGVQFGQPYQDLLRDGKMVPDSNDAAIAFGLLRDQLPAEEQVNLAGKMQEAFYKEGKSLSDVKTIKMIAAGYGLNTEEIAEDFERISAEGKYHPDFYEAQAFGVTSYPTLIIEVNGKYYDLKGNAMTVTELERNLDLVKQKGGLHTGDTEHVPNACRIDGSGC